MERKPDIELHFGMMSTIWQLRARTKAGRAWIAENVEAPPDYMGGDYPKTILADWRQGRAIALGAKADGLLVVHAGK